MSIAVVLILLVLVVVMFATEWIPIEVFSLLTMVALVATGVLTPARAFLGFGSSAVIMIAGVMILTGGLLHNGAVEVITARIPSAAAHSERRMAAFLLGAVNFVSSVINNVAATALFIPVAEGVAANFRTHRGKYLMAVAFASMTGGVCTLIGTSTNIAVARSMEQYRLEPLGMFELTPLGLAIAVTGLLYLLLAAPRLLPAPDPSDADMTSEIREFLYELIVVPFSSAPPPVVGDLDRRYGISVLAVVRGDERIDVPDPRLPLRQSDLLLVKSTAERIDRVRRARGFKLKSMPDELATELVTEKSGFAEATVSYNSPLIGKTLQLVSFRQSRGLSVLAIHRKEHVIVEKVGKIPLKAGDVLLLYGSEDDVRRLGGEPMSILVESVMLSRFNGPKALQAGIVFAAVVACSTTGWLDAPTAFLGGGALVLALRCVSAAEVGAYLNIRFLVMLAGMAALGTAMEDSGAATFLADGLVRLTGVASPLVMMAAFFGFTVLLTQPLNNAAAALLVLPIAVHAALSIGVDARPFVVTVAVAASCSFITPFEPANLLVYSRGNYRFLDFVRVGSLLTVLAFGTCMMLIPLLWPFRP